MQKNKIKVDLSIKELAGIVVGNRKTLMIFAEFKETAVLTVDEDDA